MEGLKKALGIPDVPTTIKKWSKKIMGNIKKWLKTVLGQDVPMSPKLQLLCVAISTSGFVYGYDTGQIACMLLFRDFIDRFGPEQPGWEWEPTKKGLLVSLMTIGCVIGALSGSFTADRWGRRWSIIAAVSVFIIGNIIQVATMRHWVQMMMGRFVAGIGLGSLSVVAPMFQAECVPPQIRGALMACLQLMLALGMLIANLVNLGMREIDHHHACWRVAIGLSILFSLPIVFISLKLPESPRWLISQNKQDEAEDSLRHLRGAPQGEQSSSIQTELNEIRISVQKQNEIGNGSWYDCFKSNPATPRLLYRTVLGIGIYILQQLTGVNFFIYYGCTLFKTVGFYDAFHSQLILSGINLATTFPGLYLVEKFGRRRPLIYGAICQAVCFLVYASVGTFLPPKNSPISGILIMTSASLFIASFAMTWGPIVWVVVGEMFPLRTRAKQMALAIAAGWLGNFLVVFLSPHATCNIPYQYGYVFAAGNVIAALVIGLSLFETCSLSLEGVDDLYRQTNLKPWNTRRMADVENNLIPIQQLNQPPATPPAEMPTEHIHRGSGQRTNQERTNESIHESNQH